MTTQIKTGSKNLADCLLESGVQGRKFLDREVGRKGGVYEVLKICPERTLIPYVDGTIRNEATNVAVFIRHQGTKNTFQTILGGHLEDLEVME